MSILKSDVALAVNDTPVKAYLARPSTGGPGVLLLHAWWGLKPFFKQVCDQLASQGFTVLAPDYYQGHIATTIEEANALRDQIDQEMAGEIIKAAHDYLAALGQPIGVIGFSMGASWAVWVASREADIAAVVQFYGAGMADFSTFKAKVLGHFSDVDEWEPLEWVNKMEAEMKSAGVDVTIQLYPGAAHWFVEADRPEYDKAAATWAWERTVKFLRANL